MIEFIFELLLEVIFEFIGFLTSSISKKVAKLFYRTPGRWQRLEEKHRERLLQKRTGKREKIEKKLLSRSISPPEKNSGLDWDK